VYLVHTLPIAYAHMLEKTPATRRTVASCRLLTGMKIRTEAECMQALELLHNKGASVVVLTSCTLAEFEDRISVYGSSRVNGKSRRFRCAIKRLPVCASPLDQYRLNCRFLLSEEIPAF
jgi:hypothetical protein